MYTFGTITYLNKIMIMTERYENDNGDILNYVTYSTKFGGDEVLQHKKHGTEMAHITLHPDGVYVREKRSSRALIRFVNNRLSGFSPSPSIKLQAFLRRVQGHI